MGRYDWLFEAAQNVVEVRSYSGRGMYGRRCLGVVVEQGGALGLAADLMEEVHEDNISSLAEVLREAKTDSLGFDEIVYFPQVEWQDSWDGEDDEDEDCEDDAA